MFRLGLILVLCFSINFSLPAFARETTFANLPADLWHDGQSLFSQENAWWLLGGTALTLLAHEVEDPDGAARALNTGFIDPMVDFGNIWGDSMVQAPLALGCWALGSWKDDEQIADLGYDLTRGLFLTYTVTGIIKHSVQRTRPNGESLSFPSGHTGAAFTTAGVLSRHYGGWVSGVGIGLGILTGLGRMEDEKHFASDVLAGATIGWIIGRTVGRENSAKEMAWQVVPMGTGLAMVARF